MERDQIIAEYNRIKNILGNSPSSTQFYNHTNISKRLLSKVFGRNAFSSLAIACGDIPNRFSSDKSSLSEILKQYGELTRILRKPPIMTEWDNANLKPSTSGIEKSHQIKWSELPKYFMEFAKDKGEWNDVVEILPRIIQGSKSLEGNNEECFVYLMLDTKTYFYKIGISKIAEYREKTLQSEKPSIILIAAKKYINRRIAGAFEKALHDTFSHKRKRGEWFILSEEDVEEIKTTLSV